MKNPSTTATSAITISLKDQSGLDATKYSVYILGFSAKSQKMLSVSSGTTASFVAITQATGSLPAYKLGSQITQISVDMSTPFEDSKKVDGARIYFFVANNSLFPKPPVVTYTGNGAAVANVDNPPNTSVPPYTFAEFTLVDLAYGPVIDLQTVDGFTFPVNLTLTNSLGEVGQSLTIRGVTRTAIINAYAPFMKQLGAAGTPYLDMQYSANSGGLLNPGIYLSATNSTGELTGLASPLNNVFDADVATLFSNSKLSIQGVSAAGIATDIYTVQSTGPQPLPGTSGFSHPALQFKGKKNGQVFNVYNPIGISTLSYTSAGKIKPISGQLTDATLKFAAALPAGTNIQVGMYVIGAGVDPNNTKVASITLDANKNITGVVLNAGKGIPAPSQYGFSKIPGVFWTSGAMVFANAGTFAYAGNYSAPQQAVVLNLQNQLVSALNRGVANKAPTSGSDGYSSAYWGTQTNWYPAGTTQNLFSLFMHTATVLDSTKKPTPVFVQARNSVKSARGTVMGQAYGFAYDENAGPVPPAPKGQPEVPSKFDPLPAAATAMTITLGPWS